MFWKPKPPSYINRSFNICIFCLVSVSLGTDETNVDIVVDFTTTGFPSVNNANALGFNFIGSLGPVQMDS